MQRAIKKGSEVIGKRGEIFLVYVPELFRMRKERTRGRKPEILDAWVCWAIGSHWQKPSGVEQIVSGC